MLKSLQRNNFRIQQGRSNLSHGRPILKDRALLRLIRWLKSRGQKLDGLNISQMTAHYAPRPPI